MAENLKTGKKKIIIGIVIIITLLIVVAGVMIINAVKEAKYQKEQETILIKEADKISGEGRENLKTEDLDMKIYTEGDYAKVEKAMKEFNYKVAQSSEVLDTLIADTETTIFIEPEKCVPGGAEFSNMTQLVSETKEKINAECDKILALADRKAIENSIDPSLDQYYLDLYDALMIESSHDLEFAELETDLNSIKENVGLFLDKWLIAIDYLKSIEGRWEVEGDYFLFNEQAELDQYNQYIDDFVAVYDEWE